MALRLVRISSNLRALSLVQTRCMSGEGAGKGGGAGGAIRDAGGSFGKREAALEEQYFRRKQEEQLAALKESVVDEIKHHEEQIREHKQAQQLEAIRLHHDQEVEHHVEQIKAHQEAIDRHKSKMKKLEKMSKDD